MSSKVYFIDACVADGESVLSEKACRLFEAGDFGRCFRENDFTAVKVHVGEQGNTTYIRPGCIKGLIEQLRRLQVKPFLTDTSALYTGQRHNAIDHQLLAWAHGFNIGTLGIPFIAPDGLFGTAETAVAIDGELQTEVFLATDIVRCQSILSVAHVTGHCATGLGATLKTLGMGCASRKGKMRQHAALKPSIKDNCTRCGQCSQYCPTGAIRLAEKKAEIDPDKCIGCAECVAVCRFDAVAYDWKQQNPVLQKHIAEHALGVLKGKQGRAVFFNFIISVTKDCDCFDKPDMPTIVEDIGIVASTDPIAVDKAALDLVEQAGGKSIGELIGDSKLEPEWQLEHAERIGLGSTSYELVHIE